MTSEPQKLRCVKPGCRADARSMSNYCHEHRPRPDQVPDFALKHNGKAYPGHAMTTEQPVPPLGQTTEPMPAALPTDVREALRAVLIDYEMIAKVVGADYDVADPKALFSKVALVRKHFGITGEQSNA